MYHARKLKIEMIEKATNKKGNDLKTDMGRAFLKIEQQLTEANTGLVTVRMGEKREEIKVFTQLRKKTRVK